MKLSLLNRRWATANGFPPLGAIALLLIILIALISTASLVEFDLFYLLQSVGRLGDFLGRLLTTPEWSYLPTLTEKMLETITMGFLGTVFALILSLPLGIIAAKNSSPHPLIFHFSRNLLSFMRALPELVWALVFVSALGLGPLPGILALTFVTTGFMAKFFAESLEVVSAEAIEGVTATGAGKIQLINFALFPQAFPDFIGTTLYILDHNIRLATVLGLVGAGGIGYELAMSIRLFQYSRLILLLFAIYLAVTVLDRLSSYLRSRVI